MPSSTLRVVRLPEGRRAARTAFPRGAWEPVMRFLPKRLWRGSVRFRDESPKTDPFFRILGTPTARPTMVRNGPSLVRQGNSRRRASDLSVPFTQSEIGFESYGVRMNGPV